MTPIQRLAQDLARATRTVATGNSTASSVSARPAQVDALAAAWESGLGIVAKPIGVNGRLFFCIGRSTIGGPDVIAAE